MHYMGNTRKVPENVRNGWRWHQRIVGCASQTQEHSMLYNRFQFKTPNKEENSQIAPQNKP